MKKKPPVLKQFDQISQQARDRIYALVMNHAKKNPNSPWSGKYLVDLEKSVKAFYKEMGMKYQGAFRDTLPDMMKSYYDAAAEEIKTAGVYKAIKGEPDPKRVKYFLESSFEQVAMKTDKMSFEHIKQLRNIAADVIREMSITGNTRREVSKAMLERALNIKGFEFTDKSGAKWSNKSYFNMLARTELMNAARASYDDKMAEEGFDVVKLSVSGNSCDHCAKYEGELFSLTGATAGIPSKADLEADGVFHPNCTHSYSLVPPSLLPEEIINANSAHKHFNNATGEVFQAQSNRAGHSIMLITDGSEELPRGKYNKLHSVYRAAQKSEEAFIAEIRQKGFVEDSEREFAAVWDKNGNLYCVAMGMVNNYSVQFKYPENADAKVIHNHPRNFPPSLKDFEEFASGGMSEMQIITKNGAYVLKKYKNGVMLDLEEVAKKHDELIGERDFITLEEWEKLLNGSKYKISYRNS